jgi:hypothetical protein
LANHPIFSGAVAQILMLSMAEPIEEKRRIYRNMALNTVVKTDIETDMKMSFIRMMNEFTVSHIRLLMLFNQPNWTEILDMNSNCDDPNYGEAHKSIGFRHITEQMMKHLDWLDNDIFFARMLLLDLVNTQILVLPNDGIGGVSLGRYIDRPATSLLGAKFVAFATSPIVKDHKKQYKILRSKRRKNTN